jgi:hypothetical protein
MLVICSHVQQILLQDGHNEWPFDTRIKGQPLTRYGVLRPPYSYD